jgi:hypothetical protein
MVCNRILRSGSWPLAFVQWLDSAGLSRTQDRNGSVPAPPAITTGLLDNCICNKSNPTIPSKGWIQSDLLGLAWTQPDSPRPGFPLGSLNLKFPWSSKFGFWNFHPPGLTRTGGPKVGPASSRSCFRRPGTPSSRSPPLGNPLSAIGNWRFGFSPTLDIGLGALELFAQSPKPAALASQFADFPLSAFRFSAICQRSLTGGRPAVPTGV